MKINLNTLISESHSDDIEVTIKASEYTKELGNLIELINAISTKDIFELTKTNQNEP